jgi:hypothetical protein
MRSCCLDHCVEIRLNLANEYHYQEHRPALLRGTRKRTTREGQEEEVMHEAAWQPDLNFNEKQA